MKPSVYFFACFALASTLHAATLYTGSDLDSVTSGTISDYQGSPPNHSAGKFTLTSSTSEIKAISFYGFYFGGGADPSVTTDIFDIVFFTNGLNGPDSVIGSVQTSLVAERAVTVASAILGRTIYSYQLNLFTEVALPAGDYWISISRNNPIPHAGTGANWIWSSDQTEAPALLSQSGNPFSFGGTDNANPAFTLEDTLFSVPEPHSLLLSAMTTAMLAVRRKRSALS
jgi:hypothetical protein